MQLDAENIRKNSDIDEELCTCFKDRQKASDQVNWTKLTQILKAAGIVWHERLIRNFYMDQSVELKVDQGKTRNVKI
jgi:hypothetical protein